MWNVVTRQEVEGLSRGEVSRQLGLLRGEKCEECGLEMAEEVKS
jgi:hypothetical protein